LLSRNEWLAISEELKTRFMRIGYGQNSIVMFTGHEVRNTLYVSFFGELQTL